MKLTDDVDIIEERGRQSKGEWLVEKFNRMFPVGARVAWRPVGKDPAIYQLMTVRKAAFDLNGQSVCFLEERRGVCSIEREFVDYEGTCGRWKKYQVDFTGRTATGIKYESVDIEAYHFPSIGETILAAVAKHAEALKLECPFEITAITLLTEETP